MRRLFVPLLLALCSAQASAFAVFKVNSPDDTLGTATKCTLRAAFENINQMSATAGLAPGEKANPACPAGQASNFIYFTFAKGPSGYPEIQRDPLKTSWNLIKNRAVLVGVLLNGRGQTRILRVSASAKLELEHVWLEEGGGGGSGTAVLVDGAETASLHMFDVRVVRNKGTGDGGAIAFTSYGRLTVNRSYFGSNTTIGRGGALWLGTTTTHASIIDSTFEGNRAETGGGAIVCSSGATPATLENVSLRGNRVTQPGANGGGAILNSCKLKLRIAEVVNNSTRSNGGGGVQNLADGQLTVVDSKFHSNRAGDQLSVHGGGIANAGELTVNRTSFQLNNALAGGAIAVTPSATNRRIEIANSTFVDNIAHDSLAGMDGEGAAIWFADVPFKPDLDDYRVRLFNNTFFENSGLAQLWLDDDGGTENRGILFVNNLLQDASVGGALAPNCGGRVSRLQLEAVPGQGVDNTQYPGTTCDQPGQSMSVMDLGMQQPQYGGFFHSAYLMPAGGAGALPPGDFATCLGMLVGNRDQFGNARSCLQGAVEAPPTFKHSSNTLPH